MYDTTMSTGLIHGPNVRNEQGCHAPIIYFPRNRTGIGIERTTLPRYGSRVTSSAPSVKDHARFGSIPYAVVDEQSGTSINRND
jgi:hypothetical protein